MKRRSDVLIKCPYYKEEEKQKIFCEGVQPGTGVHLAFDTPENLRNYKNQFCKSGYNRCRIAEMHNRKWGYDG